ncbi:hypothetical protein M758_10G004500 [Ceratodon purpureus]|nr:hypothetical protein M758_10G004500 [Ceratodon purpureus]
MRGERMKSSLKPGFSGEALTAGSSGPEKVFDGVGDGAGASNGEKDMQGSTLGIKGTVGNAKDVTVSTKKRGASVQGSTGAVAEKVPYPSLSQCRSKKTTLPPTAQGSVKAHHHRRSPSLHVENVSAAPGECPSGSAPSARTLRQSASFSGGITSTPRPGVRDAQASPTPRPSASKTVRHAASISRRVEDDATFCQDHNVQVFVRARPVNGAETALQGEFARCVRQENAQTISWLGQPETRFTFDHVAGEFVSQGEVFRMAGLPMVDNCVAGYNSCMFAYGQTGSGKTHTMLGDVGDIENRGMTPRVFEYLFARIRKEEEAQKQRKLKYKCRCSFLEIYNEQISDLLEPSSTNLQMREDVKKGVFVEGLLEVEVRNVEDVLHLLLLGATNRKVASTNMNRESSRSHSVFTCVIESQWECDSMINFRFGRLNLVDLAGSERQKDTGADEERLREAASINKSLSTLGLVIMVLVDIANGKQRHVPYRDSKLTFLLQDSLGGNSKTTIIANISPSGCASSETLSTLKFAQRAKFIQNNAVINEEFASGDVKGLQEQIHQLKDELARVRRQSVRRIPSVWLSERKDANVSTDENTGDAKDCLDPLSLSPTEGSFLQFGRAVPSPTVLNYKMKAMEALLVGVLQREKPLAKASAAEIEHLILLVKQREEESHFHETRITLPQELRKQEIHSETCDAEESSSASSESELPLMRDRCDNLDHTRLEPLPRCRAFDVYEKRETLVQDIPDLRKKLLDMLDKNISMDAAAARPQQEALLAELAAEREISEHLRNEVESHQRDLSECRMKLQIGLEYNKRISRDLDALRLELESLKEECKKHKQDLATFQLKKALEVNCLELGQAQHQNVVLELKTQLQKSEEKAEQEKLRRSQSEVRLQEALQESSNLQTELQWTKDSLEGAEAVMGTFQRSEPVLGIGDPKASYETFMVGQLQAEIIEMHARLEDERRHGRELEDEIKANNGNFQDLVYNFTNNCPKHEMSTGNPCSAKEKRKTKHQEAILQLQMELALIDGPGASDAINDYRWDDGPVSFDMETLEGVLAGERQNLTEEKVSTGHLQQQLEDSTESNMNTEKGLNLVDFSNDPKRNGNDLTSSTRKGGECFWKLQQEWEGAALRMFNHMSPFVAAPSSEQDTDEHKITAFSPKEGLPHALMLATSTDKKPQDASDMMFNSTARCPDTCNIMEAVLQPYQRLKVIKKNLEACDVNLRKVGQKSEVASNLMSWMSETATLRHDASRVTWDGQKRNLRAEIEVLEMQLQSNLEKALLELSTTEVQVQEVLYKIKGELLSEKQNNVARERAMVEAIAEAEQRYILAEAARLKLEEELGKQLEAARDWQHQINMKEESIVKLKEQAAADLSNWVLENPDPKVALREADERSVEKNQVITNLETILESLKNPENKTATKEILGESRTTEDARQLVGQKDLKPEFSACSEVNCIDVAARDKCTMPKIVVLQSICEGYPSAKTKVELARTQVLLTGSEGKVKLLSELVAKVRKNKSEDRCKAGSVNEKQGCFSVVPKEERGCNILKAMMFSLDKENADLQHQLLETEANSTVLKSTIENLQRELQESSHQRNEEVAALVSQLHVSDRHIFKLECQSVELRDAMQRQAVAFGALYEQLQKQEGKAELVACRKKEERYEAKSRKLKSQVEALQQELEKMQPLREEIVLIYEELYTSRTSADMATQETERLRRLVEDLERNIGQLQEDVKRKQCAIEALEEHLLKSEQSKLQCQQELQLCEQKAAVNKTRAQEKQVEVEILGKTVEELENTVYALESQVGLLKREGDRQCSMRDDMERELQGLQQQNVNLHVALSHRNSASGNEVRREFNTERKLEEREAEIQLLRKKLEKHQIGPERKSSLSHPKDIQKAKKNPKGSIGSAFRWFKMNHQVHSESDEGRKASERRIQELENVLGKRQLEITALQENLADSERVTRDVLLVLRGVKVDMASAADEEVGRVRSQLKIFIEERESWLEIISRKQAELTAAQMAMEKLREHEKALVAENKKFKNENRMQVKKMGQLEQEIKILSGQQTKHHVKIKNENNALRIQNNDLSAKLKRVEHANTRISDELAKYRLAQGRRPLLNIEEEQRLRTRLQEAQERSCEVAKQLASFSASVMKATGMFDCNNNITGSPSVALKSLEQMKTRLETIQLELDDFKLKTKIVEERLRLSEMRTTHSSMIGIDSLCVTPR